MSGTSVVPGLIVLALGLLAGFLLAARLRRGRSSATAGVSRHADLDLELADLAARRDEIYARLGSEAEEITEAERRELELAAARTLKRMDEIEQRTGKRMPPAARVPSTAPVAGGRRAALVGFAFGAGFAVLVSLLVFWAMRDATPAPVTAAAASPAAPGDDAHERLQDLSPQARARVGALMARLDANPEDLGARKALTETLVMEGLFFEAYEQSERILDQQPGDVDGLYFQGLVRLTMGQDDLAAALLDDALAREPEFVSARLVRGMARLRQGDRRGAIEDWRRGLEAAGGEHAGLGQLLSMAEAGASAEQILGSPPPASGDAPASPAGGRASPPPAAARPAASMENAFHLRVELAPGVSGAPGAVLYAFLRTGAGGAPAAVKRIDAPSFPLQLSLGAGDAMPGLEGRQLPETGLLVARLDSDGSVTTRDPADPTAETEARLGETVTLVLE